MSKPTKQSDVPTRVLEAAKQIFFAHGYHKTSLRAIAKEAGTSESGVLRFFDNKVHLLQCVYASCWKKINDHLDRIATDARAENPDPRHVLLVIARAILEQYQSDEPMMYFMLSTFRFEETSGYPEAASLEHTAGRVARLEYRRYVARIHQLCDEVVAQNPVFVQAGLSGGALANFFMAALNGIQAAWYGARLEPGIDRPQLAVDEAISLFRLLLYQACGLDQSCVDEGPQA